MHRRKSITILAALSIVGLALTGCSNDPLAADAASTEEGTIAVGSANFPESELLAEIYSQALEGAGFTVKRSFNIGAREVYLAALRDGSIDVLPEYNGALLAQLSVNGAPEGVTTSEQVNEALKAVLPEGMTILPSSAAEDKDVLVVTKETAKKYNLKLIADLTPIAGELVVGAGPGWDGIYQGTIGLKDKYGINFKEFKPLDGGGPLTVTALINGDVQVANLFSTDSSITTEGFVTLKDTKDLFLSENITPFIRESKVNQKVEDALNAVSKALTTENLTEYLAKIQIDKTDNVTVATEFLTEYDLK